jgi:hypothetical protein
MRLRTGPLAADAPAQRFDKGADVRKSVLILTLGTAFSLAAAEPHFGAQAALAFPVSDLGDDGYVGLQLGGHGRWYFKNGHGLMARADVSFYGSNKGTDVTGWGVGADYTFHVDQRPTGVYLLAGLSHINYHASYSNRTWNDGNLGINLGAGYDLDSHLGLQVRYTSTSLDHNRTYGSLNLGATYTF